jgi:hypothetical protein
MNELVNLLTSLAQDSWQALVAYLSEPWITYQLLMIAIAIIIARLLKSRIRSRLESPARKIKGRPRLLRVVVVLLRRTHHILFMLMTGILLLVPLNPTWPGHSFLIAGAFKLSLAWVLISGLSAVIRGRFLSRTVAMAGWSYASLYIFGITGNAAVFLDNIGFELGDVKITLLLVIKFIAVMTITLWLAFVTGACPALTVSRSH